MCILRIKRYIYRDGRRETVKQLVAGRTCDPSNPCSNPERREEIINVASSSTAVPAAAPVATQPTFPSSVFRPSNSSSSKYDSIVGNVGRDTPYPITNTSASSSRSTSASLRPPPLETYAGSDATGGASPVSSSFPGTPVSATSGGPPRIETREPRHAGNTTNKSPTSSTTHSQTGSSRGTTTSRGSPSRAHRYRFTLDPAPRPRRPVLTQPNPPAALPPLSSALRGGRAAMAEALRINAQHHHRRVRSEPEFDNSGSAAATTHEVAPEIFARADARERQRNEDRERRRIEDEQQRKKDEEEKALDAEEMRTRARLDDRARLREEAKAKRDAEDRKRAEEDRLREEHETQREEALRKARLQHEKIEEERKAQRDREETERIKRQIQEGRDREEVERERQARLDAEERHLRDIEAKEKEDRERGRQARLQREREARLEAEQRHQRDLKLQEQAERDREERAQLERERQARLDVEERRLRDLDAQMRRLAQDSIPPRAPSPRRPSPTTYASNRPSADLQQTLHHYEQLEAQLNQRIHDSDLRRAEHDYEYLDRRVRERQLHHAGQERIDGPLFGARRNIANNPYGSPYSSPLPSPTLRSPAQQSPARGSLVRGELQQLSSPQLSSFNEVEYRRQRGEVVLEQERQTAAEEEEVWDEEEEQHYQVPMLTRRNTTGGGGRARETRYRGMRRRYPD